MDVESIINQPGFCRLCVVNYDPANMTEIFDDKVFRSNTLAEIIKTVTNIEVERNGLPTSICTRCVTELHNSYNFIKICIAGNNFLCNELFEAHVQTTDEPSAVGLQIKNEPVSETFSENSIKPDLDLHQLVQKHSDDASHFDGLLEMPILSPQFQQLAHQSDEDSNDETPILETESYDCAWCNAKFSSRSSLKKHVVAGFTIPCHVQAITEISLGNNDSPFLVSDAFECASCLTKFTSKASLEKHSNYCSKVLFQSAPISEEKHTPTVNALAEIPAKTFQCARCLAKFTDKETCLAHIMSGACRNTGTEPNNIKITSSNARCPNCDRPFISVTIAMRHLRSGLCMHLPDKSKEKRPSCPSCYVSFKCKANLRHHLLAYRCKAATRFTCLSCRRRFAKKENISRHLSLGRCRKTAANSASASKIKCIHCPVEFRDVESLRDHLRLRCKDRQLGKKMMAKTRCEICGKSFTTMENLRMHLQIGLCNKSLPISESIRKRQCPHCQWIFSEVKDVPTHIRLGRCTNLPSTIKSTKKMTFQCAVCLAKSSSKANLTEHISSGCKVACVQENVRLFTCQICPRQYDQERYLARHLVTHSDKRPFLCEVCSQLFKRKSSLIMHQKLHKEDGIYKCEFCPREYKVNAKLMNHRRAHTDKKRPPRGPRHRKRTNKQK